MTRRFNLIDGLAFIAATAIGLVWVRLSLDPLKARNMTFNGRWPWIEASIFHGLLYATPILFAWSVTNLALSLRQPRPRLPLVIRSSGFVMNAAAIVGVLCVLLHYVGQTVIDPSRGDMRYLHIVSTGLPGDVGYFVVGSLVALALSRRLRPRPIWTDRIGATLGWVWVGMALLTWSRLYLYLLR